MASQPIAAPPGWEEFSHSLWSLGTSGVVLYRAMNLSLEDVAAEIGATRQGFSKLLRWPGARFLFDTFVRGCFLRREAETGFTIVVLARGTG